MRRITAYGLFSGFSFNYFDNFTAKRDNPFTALDPCVRYLFDWVTFKLTIIVAYLGYIRVFDSSSTLSVYGVFGMCLSLFDITELVFEYPIFDLLAIFPVSADNPLIRW